MYISTPFLRKIWAVFTLTSLETFIISLPVTSKKLGEHSNRTVGWVKIKSRILYYVDFYQTLHIFYSGMQNNLTTVVMLFQC